MRNLAPLGLGLLLCLSVGCGSPTHPTPAPPSPPERISELEIQNRRLQQRLRDQDTFLRTYSSMMNDILRTLRAVAGEEQRLLEITNSIEEEGVGFRKRDLWQEINNLLSSIDTRLEQGRRAESELRTLVERAGDDGENLQAAVLELQRHLEQKEAGIRALRAQLRKLEDENAHLEREVESEREMRRHQEERLGRLQAITHAYLLVVDKRSLKELKKGGLLRRRSGHHELTPEALRRGSYERIFHQVDGSLRQIELGRGRHALVRSVHGKYPNLYRIERRRSGFVIALHDPVAFWRLSRFLIVELG